MIKTQPDSTLANIPSAGTQRSEPKTSPSAPSASELPPPPPYSPPFINYETDPVILAETGNSNTSNPVTKNSTKNPLQVTQIKNNDKNSDKDWVSINEPEVTSSSKASFKSNCFLNCLKPKKLSCKQKFLMLFTIIIALIVSTLFIIKHYQRENRQNIKTRFLTTKECISGTTTPGLHSIYYNVCPWKSADEKHSIFPSESANFGNFWGWNYKGFLGLRLGSSSGDKCFWGGLGTLEIKFECGFGKMARVTSYYKPDFTCDRKMVVELPEAC